MPLRKAAVTLLKPVRGVFRPSVSRLNRSYSAVADARVLLETELESIRAAGTWKGERVITSKQGPHINVDGSRGSK